MKIKSRRVVLLIPAAWLLGTSCSAFLNNVMPTRRSSCNPFRSATTTTARFVVSVADTSFANHHNDDLNLPAQRHYSSPLSLSLDELSDVMQGRGRAQLVWQYLRNGLDPFVEDASLSSLDGIALLSKDDENEAAATMTTIPTMGNKARVIYRKAFPKSLTDSTASLVHTTTSADGTTKLLLVMQSDGLQVETVIIPWDERQRSTLCISSQVGCKQGCTFCLTGKMGKTRSLTTDEILIQVAMANAVCRSKQIYPIDNIVFMGMGEPADNAQAVVAATRILTDREQFQLAPRRVTISTVAPDPTVFAELGQAPALLAWSVHATDDALRRQLVPTTKYTMQELREGLIVALQDRSRRLRAVMLEVTLLDHVNDMPEAAHHLADFCQPLLDRVGGMKLVINLIPWNDIDASFGPAALYRQPSVERIAAFQRILVEERGLLCYVRTTRGDDESSACGQLATKRSSTPPPR